MSATNGTALAATGLPPMKDRPPDQWAWTAYLPGGEELREQDDHAFADVLARPDCYAIECHPLVPERPAFALHIGPGETPVFFRRRTTPEVLSGQGEWKTIHCLGRERADGFGSYVFWDNAGHIVITGDRELI